GSRLAATGLDTATAPRDIQCCVVFSTAGTFEDNCEVVTTDTECDALGGFTYPLTGTCNPNPCPFPAFACCVSSSPSGPQDSCRLVTTSEQCDDQGGTSLVDITACTLAPCGVGAAILIVSAPHELGVAPDPTGGSLQWSPNPFMVVAVFTNGSDGTVVDSDIDLDVPGAPSLSVI